MPLYEYECEACHERFERIQKYSDPLVDICPKCGTGPVRKLLSSPAIQFKGTGWYITDYAKRSGTDAGKTGSTENSSGDSSTTSAAAKSDEKKSSEQKRDEKKSNEQKRDEKK